MCRDYTVYSIETSFYNQQDVLNQYYNLALFKVNWLQPVY
jgi:hypothetical protein